MNEFPPDLSISFAPQNPPNTIFGTGAPLSRQRVRNGSVDNGEEAAGGGGGGGERESTEPPLIIGISRSLGAYHNTMYN